MASGHRLVVESPARRRRRHILVVIGSALALLAGVGLYALGRWQAPGDLDLFAVARFDMRSDRRALLAENRRLAKENNKLTAQTVMHGRAADVDKRAAAALRKSLAQMQSHMAELKKELAFYRGIVSPKQAEAGLRVQDFSIDNEGEDRVYSFHLVLIQALRHKNDVSGHVKFRLAGLRHGESVRMDWSRVALDSKSKLVFSFKYFQELTGSFRVPKKFDPTRVTVAVVRNADRAHPLTKTYRWQDIVKTTTRAR